MFSPFQCLTLQGMLSEGSVSTVFDTDSVRKPLHVKGFCNLAAPKLVQMNLVMN